MTYIKVNENIYPAIIEGKIQDSDWDNRESKSITMNGTFSEVDALFPDGAEWSILDDVSKIVLDENGQPVMGEDGSFTYETVQTEFDNSDFHIRGDLTIHTDGTCTVKMGKPTDLEDAYEILYGGM
jgi:hypothetical protein